MYCRLLIIALLISPLTFAQVGAAHIKGEIYNPRIEDNFAFVKLSLDNTDVVASSDEQGKFWIDNVLPGTYDLRLEFPGLKDLVVRNIQVDSGQVRFVELSYPEPCPNVRDIHNKQCPTCHEKNKVVPIVYGLPSEKLAKQAQKGKVFLGGCVIFDCSPQWYCKRDKLEFTN